jgi:hypothetical protein
VLLRWGNGCFSHFPVGMAPLPNVNAVLIWPMDRSIESAVRLLRKEIGEAIRNNKGRHGGVFHMGMCNRFLLAFRKKLREHWQVTDRRFRGWPFVASAWSIKVTGRRGCAVCGRQPTVDPLLVSSAKASRVGLRDLLRHLPNCWELRLTPDRVFFRSDDSPSEKES